MASNIDPTQINILFPIADKNQPSQGFRSNFSAIQNNFTQAKTEISTIQSTTITVSGDITNTGNPPVLGQSSTLTVPLVLSLSDIITADTIDTSTKDYRLGIDSKGRIDTITEVDKNSYTGNSTPTITVTSNISDVTNPNSTGIKSLSVPNFTINSYGEISKVEYQTIDSFGLLGYSMPTNAIMIGNSLGNSTFLEEPSNTGNYALSLNDGVISWKEADLSGGIITSVVAGNYISVFSSGTTATVSLDLSSITTVTDSSSSSYLLKNTDGSVSDITHASMITMLKSDGFLTSLSEDTNPTLGGNLQLDGKNISSNSNLVITTAGTLTMNGITYPSSVPTNDSSYLVFNKDGSTSFSTSSEVFSVTGDNGISSTTSSTGSGVVLSLDYSSMTTSTVLYRNAEIVVLDTSDNKTSLVKLSDYFGTLDNLVFVSVDDGSDSNTGGFNSPFKTIQGALNSGIYDIVLFPGTYKEDIILSSSTVKIVSFYDGAATINGSVTLSSQTTEIVFVGVNFTLGTTNSYIFSTYTTNGDILFKDCTFTGGYTSSSSSIFTLSGTVGTLTLQDCDINGVIQTDFTSGTVIIDGDYQTPKNLRYISNNLTTTHIRNISNLLSLSHVSGSVYLDNVDLIYDTTSTTLTNINSTSSNSTDILSIRNSSCYNPSENNFTVIDISGSCEYYFHNFVRDDSNNSFSGTMLSYDNIQTNFSQIIPINITAASYIFSPYEKYYRITNTVDTTIKLTTPNTSYYSSDVDITIKIKLVGSGYTFAFDTSTSKSTAGVELSFDGTSGENIVYEFIWDNDLGYWNCINSYSGSSTSVILTNVTESISSSGTTLSTATALTSKYNILTTVSTGSGVSLPSVSIGTEIYVLNRTSNNVLVYPDSSSNNIETLSAGSGQTVIGGGSARFIKTTSTLWRAM